MKLYSVTDLANARGIARVSALLLARRHGKGTHMGKMIVFTPKDFKYLTSIPDWNKYDVSMSIKDVQQYEDLQSKVGNK